MDTATSTTPSRPATAPGFATVNPVMIVRHPDAFITFLREVFGGHEHEEVRTIDVDGLLLHAEFEIGGVTITIAERKPDWPYLPQLTQIYVDDVDRALAGVVERGGRVVTQPTDLYGTLFSRMLDPWGNLWWVYRHGAAPDLDWTAGDVANATEWTDPGLAYIHRTVLEAMRTIGIESNGP